YSKYYKLSDSGIIYCKDITSLISDNLETYNANDWRLNIDKNVVSLKAFLVHNDNRLPIVLIAYGKGINETNETISEIVNLIKYEEHRWLICCDLKMVALLFGIQ